jgi:hypothetical protein
MATILIVDDLPANRRFLVTLLRDQGHRLLESTTLPSWRLRNDGNTPLAIEGRFEFIKPGATAPTAVVSLAHDTLLTEPILTGLFSVKLLDPTSLPSGRYLVRAIIDYGADHYIGTQREMVVVRGVSRSSLATHPQPDRARLRPGAAESGRLVDDS